MASGHTEEHQVCCCPLKAHDQRAPSQPVHLSPQGCSPVQNFTITVTHTTHHTHHTPHTHTCWSRDLCLGILLISELSPCCMISSAWIPRFQICILLPRCDLAYLASWRSLCHFIFSKCQYLIVSLLIPNSVPSYSPCPAPVQFEAIFLETIMPDSPWYHQIIVLYLHMDVYLSNKEQFQNTKSYTQILTSKHHSQIQDTRPPWRSS